MRASYSLLSNSINCLYIVLKVPALELDDMRIIGDLQRIGKSEET